MTQVPLRKVWRLELHLEALRVAQNSQSSIRCWVHAATYTLIGNNIKKSQMATNPDCPHLRLTFSNETILCFAQI